MQVFATLATMAFTGFIIIGAYIYGHNPKASLNRLFLAKSLLLALSIFIALLMQLSPDLDALAFWYKAMLCLLVAVTLLFLAFYLELTGTRPTRPALIAVGVSALAVLHCILTMRDIFSSVRRYPNGVWVFAESFSSPNFAVYMAFVTVLPVAFIVMLVRWGRRSGRNRERRQARILAWTLALTLGISDLADIVLSHSGFFHFPHILPLMFACYLVAVCYTLKRYSFLVFDVAELAPELIEHVEDLVIVLDPDLSLVLANRRCRELLPRAAQAAPARLGDLVLADPRLEASLEGLGSGSLRSFRHRISLRSTPHRILADAYVSRIVDRFGDFVAILIVAREHRGLMQLRSRYGVTERQVEIMQLAIEGLSNEEIGERLFLARRTVESHLFNLYVKLDVKNKIELMRLATEFDLAARN